MDIREIDPTDTELVRRWWEIGKQAESAYRPYDFYPTWPSAHAQMRNGRPDSDLVLLGAFEASEHPGHPEQMLGAASLGLPTLDNLHLAVWQLYVAPAAQRRGIGRALTDHAADLARARGRRTMLAEVYAPLDEDGPNLRFARSLGFVPAVTDGIKVVDLHETARLWDDLADAALRRSAGYELVSWLDVVPDAWLEGFCRLNEAFNDLAPLGDLDLEAEAWDAERVRAGEERSKIVGRHVLATAAVASDPSTGSGGPGEMVGLSELVVSEHAPHRGFQSGTLVLPAHRGHRLGMLMKVTNHRATREKFPDCRIVMTGNADVNAAMNAVNVELGYRAVERCVELQKGL